MISFSISDGLPFKKEKKNWLIFLFIIRLYFYPIDTTLKARSSICFHQPGCFKPIGKIRSRVSHKIRSEVASVKGHATAYFLFGMCLPFIKQLYRLSWDTGDEEKPKLTCFIISQMSLVILDTFEKIGLKFSVYRKVANRVRDSI